MTVRQTCKLCGEIVSPGEALCRKCRTDSNLLAEMDKIVQKLEKGKETPLEDWAEEFCKRHSKPPAK